MAARWHVDLHLANIASLTPLGLGSTFNPEDNYSHYYGVHFVAYGTRIVLKVLANMDKQDKRYFPANLSGWLANH